LFSLHIPQFSLRVEEDKLKGCTLCYLILEKSKSRRNVDHEKCRKFLLNDSRHSIMLSTYRCNITDDMIKTTIIIINY